MIHSSTAFSKYPLKAQSVPGTVLTAEKMAVIKREKNTLISHCKFQLRDRTFLK